MSLRAVVQWLVLGVDRRYADMLHPCRIQGQRQFPRSHCDEVLAVVEETRQMGTGAFPKPTPARFHEVYEQYPVMKAALSGFADSDEFLARSRVSGDKDAIPYWRDHWDDFVCRGVIATTLLDEAVRFATLSQLTEVLRRVGPPYVGLHGHTPVRTAACCREDPAVLRLLLDRGFDPKADRGVVIAMVCRADEHTADRLKLLLPMYDAEDILCNTDVYKRRWTCRGKAPPPTHPCDVASALGHRELRKLICMRLLELHLRRRASSAVC